VVGKIQNTSYRIGGAITKNPYFSRGPITNIERFFGRKSEVEEIFSLIENTQCISIVGQRRIGKTSLLKYISSPKIIDQYEMDHSKFLFIEIDLQGLGDLSRSEFFSTMLEKTKMRIDEEILVDQIEKVLNKSSISFRGFLSIIETITTNDYKLIYLFDEFELITRNKNLDLNFFSGLRNLAGNYNVAFITASKDDLINLTFSEDILGSPFFNIFEPIYLSLLKKNESIQLIEEPAKKHNLSVSEQIKENIFHLAGQHPFFLQIACYNAFPYFSKDSLSDDEITSLTEMFLSRVEGHFKYILGGLNKREMNIIKGLPSDEKEAVPATMPVIYNLKRIGLLIKEKGKYQLFSEAFANYTESYLFESDEDKKDAEAFTETGGFQAPVSRYAEGYDEEFSMKWDYTPEEDKEIFNITDVFLIYNDGRLIKSISFSTSLRKGMDDDIISGMLTAVKCFVADSFNEESGELKTLQYGKMTILMERDEMTFLALVFRGQPQENLRKAMRITLKKIWKKYKLHLKKWDGSYDGLEDIEDDILDFLGFDKSATERKEMQDTASTSNYAGEILIHDLDELNLPNILISADISTPQGCYNFYNMLLAEKGITLRICHKSTYKELDKAREEILTVYHPDEWQTNKDIATSIIQKVNVAWEVLSEGLIDTNSF